MHDLSGSTALLTGASGGLGRHIGAALAAEGVDLVLSGRSEEALERRAQELREKGARAELVAADLRDASAAQGLVTRAESALGPIDILVNNAGVEITARYEGMSTEEIEGQIAVNLTAPMLLTRAALPGMLERGRGHVVNISSLAGKAHPPFQAGYGATKAGLVGFTHAVRAELRDRPVGMSVLCPGFVTRDGMYARMEDMGLEAPASTSAIEPEDVTKALIKAIRDDVGEQIVTARPVRPMLATKEVAPGVVERVQPLTGVPEFFLEVAERRGRA